MSDKSVKELTFGVLFNHKFKLLDLWGEIADDILYKNKYFAQDFFTNISTQYTTERRLFNPDKHHMLLLTSNNLIFTQRIEQDFEKDYELFKDRVENYIVPNILTTYALIIRRLGVVYTCEWDDATIKQFASQYFNPSVQNIMDFRFSKKEGTTQGRAFSENSDFINKIYTVGNISNDVKGVSYDYQMHFSPLRADVRDSIDKFMNGSYGAFKRDIVESIGVSDGKEKR